MTTRAQDDAGIVAAVAAYRARTERRCNFEIGCEYGHGTDEQDRETDREVVVARAALFAAIDAWRERERRAVRADARADRREAECGCSLTYECEACRAALAKLQDESEGT